MNPKTNLENFYLLKLLDRIQTFVFLLMKRFSRLSKFLSIPIVMTAVLFSLPVHAQSDFISIEADSITANVESANRILKGNVVIKRNAMQLNADEVRYEGKADGTGIYMATGKPVRFNNVDAETDVVTTGSALEAQFDSSLKRLDLKGDVQVELDGSILRAESIVYFVNSGEIRAFSNSVDNNSNGRATILIQQSN